MELPLKWWSYVEHTHTMTLEETLQYFITGERITIWYLWTFVSLYLLYDSVSRFFLNSVQYLLFFCVTHPCTRSFSHTKTVVSRFLLCICNSVQDCLYYIPDNHVLNSHCSEDLGFEIFLLQVSQHRWLQINYFSITYYIYSRQDFWWLKNFCLSLGIILNCVVSWNTIRRGILQTVTYNHKMLQMRCWTVTLNFKNIMWRNVKLVALTRRRRWSNCRISFQGGNKRSAKPMKGVCILFSVCLYMYVWTVRSLQYDVMLVNMLVHASLEAQIFFSALCSNYFQNCCLS
jgi:hypothetical protein